MPDVLVNAFDKLDISFKDTWGRAVKTKIIHKTLRIILVLTKEAWFIRASRVNNLQFQARILCPDKIYQGSFCNTEAILK